jgi:putative sterol carrier protein
MPDVTMEFLSQEWADALTEALNGDPSFRELAAPHTISLQQIITKPDGEVHYWTKLDGGTIAFGLGDVEGPDATITQSYETACGLARREINAVMAFMTGKIKIDGNMGQLMALQGVLSKLADAMGTLDVAY